MRIRLNPNITEKNINAVIIGWWRQGASNEEISVSMELPIERVEAVIGSHKNTIEPVKKKSIWSKISNLFSPKN